MTTVAFYEDLIARNVELIAEGESLRRRAPDGALTVSDVRRIKEAKTELLAIIAGRPTSAEYRRWASDPRPDLIADSEDWRRLLTDAFVESGSEIRGEFAALHFARCSGAGLVANGSRVRLVPGELTDAEYIDLRSEVLVPNKDAITALLAGLSMAEAA